MVSVIANSLDSHTMGRGERPPHDIFHVVNPTLGNLKSVDAACEARYERFTSVSVLI